MLRKCLLISLLFVLFLPSPPRISAVEKTKPNNNFDAINLVVAYSINYQGKIIDIIRVPEKDYIQNAFYVKTKSLHKINKEKKTISSVLLQESINDIGITNIRSPYKKYSNDNLLSVDKFGISRIYEIYYDAPIDPYQICSELMKNPDVEYAVPIFKAYTHKFKPDDPRYFGQWYLKTMNMEQAWEISKGDKEIIIAIIDSGTDWNHEDLADNIWINQLEIPDDGIDNDGNGKIDDIRGWDLVGSVSASQASRAFLK